LLYGDTAKCPLHWIFAWQIFHAVLWYFVLFFLLCFFALLYLL